ncbi:MAG: aldehyde dehydrogenase family protein [Microlunatus sp.]|nr:aldehyde dehydrogenase family protein [Microlunatus sp.]
MTTSVSAPTGIRRSDASLLRPKDLPPGQHFIDGQFRAGESGRFIDVVDPCSEQVIARVPEGSADEVDTAVGAARAAQPAWGALTPKERSGILHQIADRIQANSDLLERLESANTGKPVSVSQDDLASTVDTFRFFAGASRSITSQAAADYMTDHLSVIIREPLGVIGVVTPWNYPLLMAAWKLAPILAAGNTVVLKPSEQTPLTTLKLAELVADLLPAGVLNIITGYGPEVGGRLSSHPDLDMIALTGSVTSGRAVAKAAADSLKRVHLELGGKAPVIIFADADLGAAATALRAGGYWNSGQECGAGCRVLVHASVAEELVDHLVAEVSTLVVGEPGVGDDVEIGPLVSKAHFERVCGYLDRAAAAGIRAAVGGAPLAGPGYFVPPTVLVAVAQDAEVAREEIFGPVVTVETLPDRRRGDPPRQRRAVRAGRVGVHRERPAQSRGAREARLRHRLGQLPPGDRDRGALGRVQRLRLRPGSLAVRHRRLLPHQARDAQPRSVIAPTKPPSTHGQPPPRQHRAETSTPRRVDHVWAQPLNPEVFLGLDSQQ